MVKVRFAPSPTGFIHVGNIRTALMNWMFAKKQGGHFMLRIDDTDLERSSVEYEQGIYKDLQWLGLTWDSTDHQSKRMDKYTAAMQKLIDMGRLYPAYETADELDRKRKRQLAKGKPPVYDRAALELTEEDKQKLEAEGRKPHWRFKLDQKPIIFQDMIKGEVKIDAASISDPVLIREDGTFLYTLCSVVDDIEFEITHIIRGEDHTTNTGVQVQIFEALGGKSPTFGHHPLLLDSSGEKLSKRIGGLSIKGLRENGLEAMTILSYLARLGTSQPVEAHKDLTTLTQSSDISYVSNAPARFVETDLKNLNGHILAALPFEAVDARLQDLGIQAGMAFWDVIKQNIPTLLEAKDWWNILQTAPVYSVNEEDKAYLATALRLLPETWDENVWQTWTNALKAETGRKGKALFMPLRVALTGLDHGPEMAKWVLLLGKDKVIERLR